MTAILPAERRILDRSRLAYPVHHDGGYAVTDGTTTIHAHSLDDAKRRSFAHNVAAGLNGDPSILRDVERGQA